MRSLEVSKQKDELLEVVSKYGKESDQVTSCRKIIGMIRSLNSSFLKIN